jgi:general secretion pathway protein G
MNNLATALASFKNLYGDYPPSRVILCESGYNSLTATQLSSLAGPIPAGDTVASDLTVAQLVARSQIYLARFWPRVDFNGANGGAGLDFNGDGVIATNYFILSGSECLAFFLGGLPIKNGNGTFAMSGFSRSPINPFQNSLIATNRSVPQYEFVAGRLIDQDGDGFPSYIDPINVTPGSRRSYAYFFSYGSNAYDPNDVNGYGHSFDQSGVSNDAADFEIDDDSTDTFTEWGFQVGFPTSSGTGPYAAVSPAPNPYTTGPSSSGNVSWVNPTTFQIICSGQDGYWGLGGTYAGQSSGAGSLPINTSDPGNVHGITNRVRENDNLSNFTPGRLN